VVGGAGMWSSGAPIGIGGSRLMLASNSPMSRLKWVATQECRCGRLTGSRSWGSVARLISRGVGSLAAGSCMHRWATSTSLKLCHLTPYIWGPIQ
jgi:hypothetical protein